MAANWNTCTVTLARYRAKKNDVVEYPEAFDHVGILVTGSPGSAGLPFS